MLWRKFRREVKDRLKPRGMTTLEPALKNCACGAEFGGKSFIVHSGSGLSPRHPEPPGVTRDQGFRPVPRGGPNQGGHTFSSGVMGFQAPRVPRSGGSQGLTQIFFRGQGAPGPTSPVPGGGKPRGWGGTSIVLESGGSTSQRVPWVRWVIL